MMNVSSSTPSASEKPNSNMLRSVPVSIEANVPAMITPQLVMMPPVRDHGHAQPFQQRPAAAAPRTPA